MSVALTYYLTSQCGNSRPFCGPCVNSFSVVDCKPKCTAGPTVICLRPKIPGQTSSCDTCKDKILPDYVAVITGVDIPEYTSATTLGPFVLRMGAYCVFDLPDLKCRGYGGIDLGTVSDGGDDVVHTLVGMELSLCTGSPVLTVVYRKENRLGLSYGGVRTYTYATDTDVRVGDGCNQILTFTCFSALFDGASGIITCDGSTVMLYPFSADLPS
jgi:hypothetical protein